MAITLLSTICGLHAQNVSLSVALRPQLTDKWCWAASGQMVMEFLGTTVTQCDEANKRLNLTICCTQRVPGGCIKGGWPEFDKYGFTFRTTEDAPLSWEDLKKEIDNKRAFAFAWRWLSEGPDVSGHMMVAIGYKVDAGKNWVLVNDPWPPPGLFSSGGDQLWMPYHKYVSGSDHTHWDDYYEIKK